MSEWCQVMSDTLNMDLPWRSLRPHIVTLNEETGLVEYYSTFEELKVTNRWHDADDTTSNINEALYRHKDNLETIFRAIDKDNSGTAKPVLDDYCLGRSRALCSRLSVKSFLHTWTIPPTSILGHLPQAAIFFFCKTW